MGRGSYGEVWLARNQLGTYRAVKVIYRKHFLDSRPFDREFEGIQNFEPISRLHPGFIPILHVGMSPSKDYFFYIMEVADDTAEVGKISPENYHPKTLADESGKARKLPIPEVASLGSSIAKALDFLHSRGLIHRDIKPSNIVYLGGAPRLADVGLVTEVGSNLSFVGTSGYILPEGAINPRSDIYSLGKVLYELATGMDRGSFPELPPGTDTQKTLLLELNEVLIKACQADHQLRYASGNLMASDLDLISSGRSLRQIQQLEKHVRKLKQIAIGIIVVV